MSATDNKAIDAEESTPTATRSTGEKRRAKPKPKTPDVETTFVDVEPREYDLDLITDFLDLVFHADTTEQGEVLTWAVKKGRTPVYPDSEADLLAMLGKTRQGKALYYGTASCRPDAEGKLFNRQALFERLHVVVLDDIGTKGAASDLPEGMTPTYIVETSEGNFQYGYVLETPIDNLEAAKALVRIMYEAGIADAGGKMPNKLVRLPEGINGKKGPKANFVTKLHTMEGPLWTPQALLDIIDSGADWAEIERDGEAAVTRKTRMKGGTTPWAPYRPVHASMTGIIDPVAEWLIENEQVVTENGDWLTVQCPWERDHTTGDGTAGYKPLGVGEDPSQRGFHCFHDSCAGMHTREYLQHVAGMGGPTAAIHDKAGELISTYVYDSVNDAAWKIKDSNHPVMLSMSGMKNTHPRQTMVATPDGKMKAVSEFSQWLHSESRVTVMGALFDPSNPARLIETDGDLYVNSFTPPPWKEGEYTERHIMMFKQFLEYLIPIDDEREYFLDWLAAKTQDMGFRGAGLVMIAQVQGVGRSTLGEMIGSILGEVNVKNEPFNKLVGDGAFNEWVESPFIVSDETLNTGGIGSYGSYEKLKELIDPRPRLVTINPKYGKQRRSMVHSSFLFLSNHSNALALTEDDRRFYVISNPHKPAPIKYFQELNAWLEELTPERKPVWTEHVYRWLMQRKVDLGPLLAPPPRTTGKDLMVTESKAAIDLVGHQILAQWPCEYIAARQFTHAIECFADRLDLYNIDNYKAQIKRIFANTTYPLHQSATVKMDGTNHRFRVIIMKSSEESTPKGEALSHDDRNVIRDALIPENIKAAIANVTEILDVEGL